MKGLFKRLSILTASLAMVFGVGLVNNEKKNARASISDYTKITDISSLANGDKVVLYADAISKGVSGWDEKKDATVSEDETNWVQYEVTTTTNGVYLYDETASKYITSPGTSNVFKYGTQYVCTVNSDGVLQCNSRYLCANGTYYRMYTSIGDDYAPFYVYKVNVAQTTKVSSIKFKVDGDESKTLNLNKEDIYEKFTYEVLPSDADDKTLEWSSTNSDVAYFEDGAIYALDVGKTTITATAKDGSGVSASIDVTVIDPSQPNLTSITVSGSPVTPQFVGNNFDYSGLTFTPNYDKENSNPETITGDMITWPVLVAGMESITGDYKGFDVIVSGVEVIEDSIISIEISGDLSTKTYVSNAEFDTTGLSVYGNYRSGKTPIKLENNDIQWSFNKTPEELGIGTDKEVEVTATYGSLTATKTITGIEITEAPKKSEFVAANLGLENTANLTNYVISNFTYTFSQNTGKNPPKYYTSDLTARAYKDNTLLISGDSSVKKINSISIIYKSAFAINTTNSGFSIKNGSSNNEKIITPNSDSTEITISFTDTSRIVSMIVTYEKIKTENKKVEQIILSPSSLELDIDETRVINKSILPIDATDDTVTWSSTNEKVAVVDQEGKVTAISTGTATIKAIANDGSLVEGTCEVTVLPATIINYTPTQIDDFKGDSFKTNNVEFAVINGSSSPYVGRTTNGIQFGTKNNPATSIKLISRNISFDKEGLRIIVNSTYSGDGPATLSVYFGNELLDSKSLQLNTPTDFEFTTSEVTAEKGNLKIVLENDTSAVYLKSIKVYGTMIAEDDAIQTLVNKIESSDTCTDYVNANEYRNDYNALSEDEKTIFNRIEIDDQDYNDQKELVDVKVKAIDKLQYMEYLASVKSKDAESSNYNNLISSSNNILFVSIICVLGLFSIGGYYFINKRRMLNK